MKPKPERTKTVITPHDRKEMERETRRENILAGARELFADHEFDQVTVGMLERRTGYSAPVIYALFGNKEGVFVALCSEDFKALRSAFDEIAKIEDPVERLLATGDAYVRFALAHPNHYRLMFMNKKSAQLAGDATEIERGNPDQDAYAFLRMIVAECLAAGRLKHPSNDPDLLAQMLWAAAHGIVALHMTHAEDPWIQWRPLGETAEGMMLALIRGLAPDTPRS